MENELYHHGVKGQKWGVRRYQNPDGSLTSLGQSRARAVKTAKTKRDVDDIISTWSKHDRKMFMIGDNEEYLTIEQGEHVVHRALVKVKNTPVSFFDLLDDDDAIQVALGTRSGDEYRGKGYAKKAAERGMKWLDQNHDKLGNKPVIWAPYKENVGSVKLARRFGFVEDPDSVSDDGKIVNYVKRYN
jgi:RimJ/RimL family protein N-acetyltransferase